MKNHFIILAAALVSAACSSPKYTYHFDHYDYNSGRKNSMEQKETVVAQAVSPVLLTGQEVVADTRTTPVSHQEKNIQVIQSAISGEMASMTKEEKREFKKALKTELKNVVKGKKKTDNIESTTAKQEWDHDLKMAAIFGIIAVVLTALGGVNTVFYILGVVSLIVAVVFLIKWLARQ